MQSVVSLYENKTPQLQGNKSALSKLGKPLPNLINSPSTKKSKPLVDKSGNKTPKTPVEPIENSALKKKQNDGEEYKDPGKKK